MSDVLFATLPTENPNAHEAGCYSNTHFRIRKNGYDGSGRTDWDESVKAAFQEEVRDIFAAAGWSIVEPARNGTAATVAKGKNCLYLHPQDFSGVCENLEREALFSSFAAAKTFLCETVDVFEEIFDMTDEQLFEKLESERDKIEADLLEAFKTKRKNLFIASVGIFGVDGQVAKKYAVKRLAIEGKKSFHGVDNRAEGICASVVAEMLQNLVSEEKILTAPTRAGTGYRTNPKPPVNTRIPRFVPKTEVIITSNTSIHCGKKGVILSYCNGKYPTICRVQTEDGELINLFDSSLEQINTKGE